MTENKRLEWADLARCLAILAVVLCHATQTIYSLNLKGVLALGSGERLYAFSLFTLCRGGGSVLFLLLTGYFLLDREYDWEKTRRFWKNNWLRLLICTELWFIVYEIFLTFYSKQTIPFSTIIADLLFLHKVNLSHVWYMPMIIAMYVSIPFVANALQRFELKSLVFPLCFFGFFALGYPFLEAINRATGYRVALQLQSVLAFSGGAYGIYLVTGYIIKKGGVKRVSAPLLATGALIFFLVTVFLQLWSYHKHHVYNVWHNCLPLYLYAVFLFGLLSKIDKVPLYPVIRWLGRYAFAIYLIHNLVIQVSRGRIQGLALGRPLKVLLLFGITFAVSVLVAWLIERIPKVGKFVLYLK